MEKFWNSHTLLWEIKNDVGTAESSLVLPLKVNELPHDPNPSYTAKKIN